MEDGAHNPPTRLSLSEFHVWLARLDSPGWPAAGGLPAGERERAARLARPHGRRRWVAARWALRGVLARYLGREPGTIELRFGERGKPMLADTSSPLRFNLSHSGELALVAVSRDREVGVDVQRIGSRPADFYVEWTRREAVAKCHGVGLWAPPPDAPVAVRPLDVGPGFAAASEAIETEARYAAAVAVAGADLPPLRRFEATPGEGPELSAPGQPITAYRFLPSRSRPACGGPRWRRAAA
jgi:4'-phosphopantetheinyl transferase